MSAIGTGVTLICGNQLDGEAPIGGAAGAQRPAMTPIVMNGGDVASLSHFVGRKAWQIIVTDDNGNVQSSADFPAVQVLNARPLPDALSVTNSSGGPKSVFIAIRWQENSVEAQLFPVGDLNDEQRNRTATVGNATVSITGGGD
jgi:hypothetical protein